MIDKLIEEVEFMLESNSSFNVNKAKDLVFKCFETNDESAHLVAIELLGKIGDKDAYDHLLSLDINESSGYFDIFLLSELANYHHPKSLHKILDILSIETKDVGVAIVAVDILYNFRSLFKVCDINRLRALYLQERDDIVKTLISGVLYLLTMENKFLDLIKINITSTDFELAKEAKDCLNDIEKFLNNE